MCTGSRIPLATRIRLATSTNKHSALVSCRLRCSSVPDTERKPDTSADTGAERTDQRPLPDRRSRDKRTQRETERGLILDLGRFNRQAWAL
jgi:hypothetical protein